MKATIVDLRYRMKEVLKALDRNEDVRILCRGKTRGVITAQIHPSKTKVSEHPFFNMRPGKDSVPGVMDRLRGGRYRGL